MSKGPEPIISYLDNYNILIHVILLQLLFSSFIDYSLLFRQNDPLTLNLPVAFNIRAYKFLPVGIPATSLTSSAPTHPLLILLALDLVVILHTHLADSYFTISLEGPSLCGSFYFLLGLIKCHHFREAFHH